MVVIAQLAASIGRPYVKVNGEPALEILNRKDLNLVSMLIALLVQEDNNIQSNLIKFLCEIGV